MLTDASTPRIEYWPILDGSKPAIEAAAVCNATGLTPAPEGLLYPPGSIDEIPTLMRPRSEGGVLHHKGQVEVISSLKRDGTPIRMALTYLTFRKIWRILETWKAQTPSETRSSGSRTSTIAVSS
jgi:hypothetical protein